MKAHVLRAQDYVQHMVDACQRIESYVSGKTRESFLAESIRQDAVIRNIEILGEASKNLLAALPDAPSRFPAVPFRSMYVTRNKITHGYFTVNLDIIWEVATTEVPNVRAALEASLQAWPADLS